MKFLLTSVFLPKHSIYSCIQVHLHSFHVRCRKKCWCGAFGVLPAVILLAVCCSCSFPPQEIFVLPKLNVNGEKNEGTWTRSWKSMPIKQIRYKNTWKNGSRTTTSKYEECGVVFGKWRYISLHRYAITKGHFYSLGRKHVYSCAFSKEHTCHHRATIIIILPKNLIWELGTSPTAALLQPKNLQNHLCC